jgi:MFS family permease
MKAQHFTPSQISSATAIGGLVTIPVSLGIGTLSDRLGRKRFLMLSYIVAAIGALTLGFSNQLWHFWVASSLLLAARSSNGSIASALATDLLTPETLGRSLPWVHTMNWIASVIGFAGTGFGIEAFGAFGLLLGATTASVVAAGMLGFLPARVGVQSAPRKQIACYLPERDGIVTAKARVGYHYFCLVRDSVTGQRWQKSPVGK